MSEDAGRPDPDALLRRISGDQQKAARGTLRVFFGFAPGVGKTYRMLASARELVDQKVDVVVGTVDTHARYETAALLLGLEVLPKKRLEYRGKWLTEFDLDGAIARKPTVLLVDELAHTNVVGSRHARRWQDVVELLESGIHVHTTLNVQHVESLNDVVAQITGVQVRETVPDTVLDRADAIELVDVSLEELLERLREGKVYLGEQADRAARNFFRRGNLLALRELALRRMAEHVDSEVQAYRQEHGVHATWPAGERVLVCVGPSPSSARLIRAACRIAAGLRAPWIAACVDIPVAGGQSSQDRDRIESHIQLAESLGASVARLSGASVSEAVLDHARKQNVTRIVIGKPTHPRLRDILRGSLVDEVVRGSGDIDVNVISGDPGPGEAPRTRSGGGERAPRTGYLAALLIVALATGAGALGRAWLGIPDISMLFLVAVMITAARWGRNPSLLAAALSVVSYDFFFVPPYFTLAVDDARHFLTFGMMFGTGLVISSLMHQIRRQGQDARSRQDRTAALYALSHDLGSAQDGKDIALATARHASLVFDAASVVVVREPPDAASALGEWPPGTSLEPSDMAVARWVLVHGRLAGFGTDTLPGSRIVCAPMRVAGDPLAALVLIPRIREALRADQRSFLDGFARQAAFALERAQLAEQARQAAVRARTEQMRSSLLSSVSHDLRTPLASITGAATTLRDDEIEEPTRRELIETICEEAERLERLLSNLLDMTRIESGAVVVKREWVPLEEIIGAALTRLEARLATRKVEISLPADLPMVPVDPVLMQQLFINLFENALKYTPPDSPIEVAASLEGDAILVDVADRGPGLTPGDEERVFERFYRGSNTGVSGVGLGLPICRGIAQVHGGGLTAANRAGGGAQFRLVIPIVGTPPCVETAEPSGEQT